MKGIINLKNEQVCSLRSIAKQTLSVIVPLFSFLFVVGTTTLIIIVMKGYSIDIYKKKIIKTGVLALETTPRGAMISVNNKDYGKTNVAIPLEIGKYSISLKKEGYYEFNSKISIEHGIATVIRACLIKSAPPQKIRERKENEEFVWSNGKFYSIKSDILNRRYSISRLEIRKNFFESAKITETALGEFIIPEKHKIKELLFAPKGSMILLRTEKLDKAKSEFAFVLELEMDKVITLTEKNAESLLQNHLETPLATVEWSPNEFYLILENENYLHSYNIKTKTRSVIINKMDRTKSIVWSASQEGVYVVIQNKLENGTYANNFSLIDYSGVTKELDIPKIEVDSKGRQLYVKEFLKSNLLILNTEKSAYLIGDIFSHNDSSITIETNSIKEFPIKHYKESGISVIEVTDETFEAPILIDSENTVIFKNKEGKLSSFVFNKDNLDVNKELGLSKLGDIVILGENFGPFSKGKYIMFLENGNLKMISREGDNLYNVAAGVKYPTLFISDTYLLYLGDDNNLYFKEMK